jgi:acyl dehydratase
MDRLRFAAPVMIGDTIRCEAELLEKTEKNANQGILTYDIRVLNQRGERVLVYLEKVLVKRQAGEKASRTKRGAGE